MSGKSHFDNKLPAMVLVSDPNVTITDNVVAGSERLGWLLAGPPCSAGASGVNGVFARNAAHSCLAGMKLVASGASTDDDCTLLNAFTSYLHVSHACMHMRSLPGPLQQAVIAEGGGASA